MSRAKHIAAVAAVVLSWAWMVQAQPLADRLPGDTMLYIGWIGRNNLGNTYERSHTKTVLDASTLRQAWDEALPRLLTRLGQDDPRTAAKLRSLAEALEELSPYPTALWVWPRLAAADAGEAAQPCAVAVISDVGGQAEALAQQLEEKLAAVAQGELRWTVGILPGGLLYVAPSARQAEVQQLLQQTSRDLSLAQNPQFVSAVTKVGAQPVVLVYVDVEQLLPMLKREADAQGRMLLQAIGVQEIRRLAMGGGFDKRDWAWGSYIEAPAPRKGLIAGIAGGCWAPDGISRSMVGLLPASAQMAGAVSGDLAAGLQSLRTNLPPDMAKMADEGLGAFQAATGLDLQKDVLAPLGTQWGYYSDSRVAGPGFMGLVLVNILRDEAKARTSLSRLADAFNGVVQQQTRGRVTLRIETTMVEGLAVHYFAAPLAAPAWAIQDGVLYAGLYPQNVVAAVRWGQSGQPSMLKNKALASLRKRAAAPAGTAFSYMDVPRVLPEGYQTTLLMAQAYLGLADMAGARTPAMVVPPMNLLGQHVAPVASFSWATDDGMYSRMIEPFPGSSLLGTPRDVIVLQQAGFVMGMLVPMLGRTHGGMPVGEPSPARVASIARAALRYADNNQGRLPADIAEVAMQYYPPACVLSPASGKSLPPGFDAWPRERRAEWLRQNASYIIVGGSATTEATDPAQRVLVMEKPHLRRQNCVAVAFLDGHAESLPLAKLNMLLLEQTGKTLDQWARQSTQPLGTPKAPPQTQPSVEPVEMPAAPPA